jgi:hypothetical protein
MVSHVSHSVHVPPKETRLHQGGLNGGDFVGIVRVVSHMSHSVHVPPKEHIAQGGARIVEIQDGWDGLTCAFGCLRNTLHTPKGGAG